MKVLVISDVHLKPWIIETADQMMEKHSFDNAVFLGDFADDWDQERNIDLYKETYAALEKFLVKYPESKVCFGNHDLSYVWQKPESGYSVYARQAVVDCLNHLRKPDRWGRFKYIHKIGNVLFSHAGITTSFLRMHFVFDPTFGDIPTSDDILSTINSMGQEEIWNDASPIWARPDNGFGFYRGLYGRDEEYLQVVGHTPVHRPEYCEECGILMTDVFSTYRDGSSIGTNQFVWVDTETKEWGEI